MPFGPRWLTAAIPALLILAAVQVVGAPSAAAYPAPGPSSAAPSWAAGDTGRNGEIWLYDSTGARITGGADYNNLGSFFAGQTTAKTTGATLANLSIAFPDNTNAVPSTWFSAALQPSTAFSTSASAPTAVGPVIAKANWPAGTTPIADTLSGGTLSTATNYQNVFELRSANSGPGVSAGGKYWAVDIEFNPGTTAFDGLAAGEWRVLQQANDVATTTSITSVTPASQNVAGGTTGSVTAVAAVSPASAAGTIQFSVDGTPSGSPVTVSAGSAAATLTGLSGALSPGTAHVVTAAFTAAAPATYYVGYANSASTNTTTNATIVWNAPAGTTTNIVLSSANINYGVDTLTATANVTDNTTPSPAIVGIGSVQFKVDGVNVGSPVNVTAGTTGAVTIPTGSLTSSAAPGTSHAVTAVYTDGNTFATSTSSASNFNVTICDFCGGEPQNVQTSIPAGTLDLSTSLTFTTPLLVPAMSLSSSASEYYSSVNIAGLSFTDTRPGNLSYTMSAISSNLVKQGLTHPASNNETISAQDVGLDISSLVSTNASPPTFLGSQLPGTTLCTPATSTFSTTAPANTSTNCQNFTGFNNAAALHVQASDPGSLGLGGSSPHPIIHANAGVGTTVFAARLEIRAPTNLVDGTYAGTVTFSIIGS